MVEAGRLQSRRLILSGRRFGIRGAFNVSVTPRRLSVQTVPIWSGCTFFFFWSFAATVDSHADSPSTAPQPRPGHGEPLRAAPAPRSVLSL